MNTKQQPPLPTLQPGDSHMESLIEAAIQGHASTRDAMRWLVRQVMKPAQQPATGEAVGQVSDLFPSVRNKLHAKGFDSDAPLYTHPAPSVPAGWRRASDLPPPGQPVIAWVDGVKVPIRAFWVPDFHLEPGDDFDTEWAKYSEEHDTFFCPSGWYESNHHEETNWQVEKPVLAWMPLPAIDAAMLAAKEAPNAAN